VKSPYHPFLIQDQLQGLGYFSISAIPMGTDLVLLDGEQPDATAKILEGAKEVLSPFFSKIVCWNPHKVAMGRLTWIKCYGVPIHA
jgi:hypothetical protein